MIHDAIPHGEERFGAKRFGEEIRAGHEGDDDLQILHALANKVVAPVHVLHARMMLRVARNHDRRLVVDMETSGLRVAEAKVVEHRPRSEIASLAASDAATISASHEERATVACFLEAHEIAADMYLKHMPEVECFTAQSNSDMPDSGATVVRPRAGTAGRRACGARGSRALARSACW